jgi:subtilisin family serine protease
MSALEPEEAKPMMESLSLYSHHAHGTHVAGILIDGNPYARVLTARLTFDHRMIPEPYTMEIARNMAEAYRRTVEYFEDHGVRVVNMSWGFSIPEIENNLEANGIGKDAEDRREMARKMFKVTREGLFEAMKSADDILFCVAAGNSDNDVEFDEFIPSSFDLPNIIVSGAVDQAGEATSFTSEGRTVRVYANGFEVESFVPGGNRVKFSGTSMASPNVANLAAKLIARDPTLDPEETARLIIEGADDMGEDGKTMRVINPKRSMELLSERQHTSP